MSSEKKLKSSETCRLFQDKEKHNSIHCRRKLIPLSILTFTSSVDRKLCTYTRAPALFLASRLEQKGKNMFKKKDTLAMAKAFDCFVSSMKIREEHASSSLSLMRSYTQVGKMILERDYISISYARIALKCFSRALVIQKIHHNYHQRQKCITSSKKESISVFLATLSCYIAKAFILIGNIDAAYKQISYFLRILKEDKEEMSKIFESRHAEVLSMCYITIANILTIRMITSIDKMQAIEYYNLAINLQEKNNPSSSATARGELASFLHEIGDLVGALSHYKAALKFWSHKEIQTTDTKRSTSNLLNNIALVFRDMNRKDQAMACLKKALTILPQERSKMDIAFIVGNISRLHLDYIE